MLSVHFSGLKLLACESIRRQVLGLK